MAPNRLDHGRCEVQGLENKMYLYINISVDSFQVPARFTSVFALEIRKFYFHQPSGGP